MMRMIHWLMAWVAALCALGLSGCDPGRTAATRTPGFDDYLPAYNRHIREWLRKQQEATQQAIAKLGNPPENATQDEKETYERQLRALHSEREKWEFRLGLGDYFKTGTPADLPEGLVWQDGLGQPEIGDPRAVKGGTLRRFVPNFPPTIRPFGDNSNNEFRGELYDYIDIPLVGVHPETLEPIPGLAREWAASPDGRTVYFRLHPEARYSDGVPVKARDFQFAVYVRTSDHIFNPFGKQFFREDVAQVAVYDDHTLSVSLPETRINLLLLAGALVPSPPHFYQEYGPDYAERYQWRFPPTTGAYEVPPDGLVKGVSITQLRVKDWWARDLKYYRHRFNPDRLVNTVVRDESKAFELFRAGELDTFYLSRPDLWYEKCEIPPVFSGYIERTTFYTRYPRLPRGFYLNVRRPPLDHRDVRIGIHHALNWQKVIDVMHRGDYQRLNAFNEGYAIYSDPSIRARPYSIPAAREAFARAGFDREGPDGILTRADGTRLSTSISYPTIPQYDRMFAILREDARACGLDLRLDGMEFTVAYRKDMLKQYEMSFSSWVIVPPIPEFHQFLHSSNAIDSRGNPKPQTNNLFVWARADTDALCDIVRNGRSVEAVRDASWKLQRIIHDEGFFVPAYTVDFIRMANWRWVRWPDCEHTRFSPPVVLDPHEVHVLWIDEAARQETLEAQRNGVKFPEVNRSADAYRVLPEAAGADPAPAGEPPVGGGGGN